MTTNEIDKAYDLGFKHCAINWAERGDLVADIGSPTYAKDKNYVLAALDASVKVPQSLKDTMEKITQRSLCDPMLVGMSEWNSMVRDVNLMLSGNKGE